uniref:Uncharacterized protein n=1 Tax=Aegilops tauschii subsp. strangulata TaxID=200361 RepID=A0A453EWZ4_AEGTS
MDFTCTIADLVVLSSIHAGDSRFSDALIFVSAHRICASYVRHRYLVTTSSSCCSLGTRAWGSPACC